MHSTITFVLQFPLLFYSAMYSVFIPVGPLPLSGWFPGSLAQELNLCPFQLSRLHRGAPQLMSGAGGKYNRGGANF